MSFRPALFVLVVPSFAAGFVIAAAVRRATPAEESLTGQVPSSNRDTRGETTETPRRPSEAVLREADRLFQVAYARFLEGRSLEAIPFAEKAAAIDASDPRPLHLQGKCYQAMFLAARAEAAFRGALARDPNFVESAKELSVVLHDAGRFREAADLLEPLIARFPRNAVLRGELAVNLLRLGEPRRALEQLEAYRAAVGENDGWTRFQIGRALADLGEVERAEAELREALRLDPSLGLACFALGRLLVASGRDAEAKPWLERYRTLREIENEEQELRMRLVENPDAVPVLVRVAQLLLQRGRGEEALQMLRRARAVSPEDASLERLYEKVASELGRRAEGER